jgi:2-succinyl-5-enolpyruvyl-6-hydroxy-3-cyclohexene-1-carboxylate synthase
VAPDRAAPDDDAARRATYACTGAFFAALASAGVRHVCVSPGSRSAPLAVAAARTPALEVVAIVDERSAGFFALGLAKRSGRPVALVCTSGSAASNYLPAVVEAHHGRVPLIVVTADRPPELQAWGAGQTIDQLGLYGTRVRRFVQMPVPSGDASLPRHARAVAARSVDDATDAPAGPVHVNWPLREPLDPPAAAAPARDAAAARPVARVERSRRAPAEADVDALASLCSSGRRGVIACGPMPPSLARDRALAALARATGWPLVADPLSGLRRGAHVPDAPVVAHADLWLRDPDVAARFAPEVVLRFGDPPTSKAFRLWLEVDPPAEVVLVDADREWMDPSHLATRMVRAEPEPLATALASRLPSAPGRSAWLDAFVAADRRAAAALAKAIVAEPVLDEARAVHELGARLPGGATLYLSSSMPVRDVDAFLPVDARPLRVLANRGANGIDGVTSSALGAAFVGRDDPTVLLTGDLALLHDLGGLLVARTAAIPLVVVVLDNDGGGIFSFLPIAAHGEAVEFERLFRTPHGLDLGRVAGLFDLGYTRADSPGALADALDRLLAGPLSRAHILHVPVDRDANVARFRSLARGAAVAAAGGADA